MRFVLLAWIGVAACAPNARDRSFGDLRWSIEVPDAGPRPALAITATGDIVVALPAELAPPATGSISDGALATFAAPDGALMWRLELGGMYMPHLAVDPSGDIALTGACDGDCNFIEPGQSGAGFAARYAPDGTPRWARTLFPGTGMCGLGIAAGSAGSAYVVGECHASFQLGDASVACESVGIAVTAFAADGTPLWARVAPSALSSSAFVATNGGVVVTRETSGGGERAMELTSAGDVVWEATLDGSAAGAVVATEHGTVVAAGIGIAMLDDAGREQWRASSELRQTATALATMPSGVIVAAGGAGLEAYTPDGAPLDVVTAFSPIDSIGVTRDGGIAFIGRDPLRGTRTIGVLAPP